MEDEQPEYYWEDDLYQYNQNEADDYQAEAESYYATHAEDDPDYGANYSTDEDY